MGVEWQGLSKSNRDELFALLNAARKFHEDGRPYYDDPLFEDVVGILEAALKFPEELPEADARRILGRVLFAPERRALQAESARQEIDEDVAVFLSKKPSTYVLVGSVSAKYFGELGNTKISGCRVSFHPRVPEPYREGFGQAEHMVRTHVPGDYRSTGPFGTRYTFFIVEAEGRSEIEAAVKAQEAMALQRGLWNLALVHSHPLVGGARPLNHLLPGPVQSLHRPDGSVLPYPVWYEPDYVGPVGVLQSKRLEQCWEDVQEYEKIAFEGLSRSRYRPDVEGFMRDYVNALDGRDPEAAFMRLWGLLERMTGLGLVRENEKHVVVTKRAAFHVRAEMRDLQYLVLEKLRHRRNTGVHEGVFLEDARDLLRQLRRYVVAVLQFHLENRFELSCLEEAARFSNQPSAEDRLRNRIRTLESQGQKEKLRLARMAMEYHGYSGSDT